MIVSAHEVAKELPALALWHGQNAESKVHHLNRPALIEAPSVPHLGREGHLPRRRHDVSPNCGIARHLSSILGIIHKPTKCQGVRVAKYFELLADQS